MNTQSIHSIRAVKSHDTNTMLTYKAKYLPNRNFEITIERYEGNTMTEAKSAQISADSEIVDALLKKMCLGSLEPCHLTDVLEDMED